MNLASKTKGRLAPAFSIEERAYFLGAIESFTCFAK